MSQPETSRAPERPRRTQQERRAATERRILEAAVHLIASSGSSAVSLADVGEAAGYSRGIVTHQFGTRDEMLRQVVRYAQWSVVPPETGARGLERLLVTVDSYLGFLAQETPAGRAFLLMWGEAAAPDSPLRPIFAERDMWFRDLLRGQICEGVSAGSIRADTDPDAAAMAIMSQLRGIGLELMVSPSAPPAETIRAETVAMVRRALQA